MPKYKRVRECDLHLLGFSAFFLVFSVFFKRMEIGW